jgi:Uma2 family endonuclease
MGTTTATRTWTYEYLFRLPDDGKRYEIIDGEQFEMPGTNRDHAAAIINLIALLVPIVRKMGGQLFTAPFDVFLPGADPVQPDVIVVLPGRAGIVAWRGGEGIPDLLIEILSPSTLVHDRVRTRALYVRAGVREFWLISPEAGLVVVLVLEGNDYRTLVRAIGDEPVRSEILPDVAFPASAIFAAMVE